VKKTLNSAKGAASATTDTFVKTANFLASTIKGIGHTVFVPFKATPPHPPELGASPGIEHYLNAENQAHLSSTVSITVIDYGSGNYEAATFTNAEEALAHPKPANPHVRWINIDGLNPKAIDSICRAYEIHTLSAEDTLNTFQRPKLEIFDDYLQVVSRQVHVIGNQLRNEQISYFLLSDTLITFQEEVGDVFDPVRKRLQKLTGRFYTYKADYLLYALLDSTIDHIFPLLEGYGTALEELEIEIMENPHQSSQQRLFSMKRDLSQHRRALWPIREVIDHLNREEIDLINEDLRTYLRDVHDHTIQIIDILESYRDTASGLNDLYQSAMGNKMNETMKVLTIMASFFIPITFLAGVYGMNFEYIPELGSRYAYPIFWGVCILTTAVLAFFFWYNGWIGNRKQ
jgi:magnesium transporter